MALDNITRVRSILNRAWHLARHNAKRKGVEFLLDKEFVLRTVQGVCYICGALGRKYSFKDGTVWVNGLDRVDNGRGYVHSNVAPCCFKCNRIKSDFELGDLLCHMRKMQRGLALLVAKERNLKSGKDNTVRKYGSPDKTT